MRNSLLTPLNYTPDNGLALLVQSVCLAYSHQVKQQLFSQDYYIGKKLTLNPGTKFIADFRPGDFKDLKINTAIKPSDFGNADTSSFMLEYTTTRPAEEIRTWYRAVLKSKRIAIEVNHSNGSSSSYNPFRASIIIESRPNQDAELNVSLLFERAPSHPSTKFRRTEDFLPPVLENVPPAIPVSARIFATIVECTNE